MGRSYLDMSYDEREARNEARQHSAEAEKRKDEVKALRQTLADLMEDFLFFDEDRAQEILLNRVRENGHDNLLINRLTRKI